MKANWKLSHLGVAVKDVSAVRDFITGTGLGAGSGAHQSAMGQALEIALIPNIIKLVALLEHLADDIGAQLRVLLHSLPLARIERARLQ